MSATPEVPRSHQTELGDDGDSLFDELAARAGAALRRPAPADGVRVIAARRRRQHVVKAGVAGGVAVAAVVVALVIVSDRDDDPRSPIVTTPTTLPQNTTVDSVPATTSTPTTEVSSPSTTSTSPSAASSLWVDLGPGATAALPAAPIPALYNSALVWTGAELIVWGGDPPEGPPSGDGAAFDPANGTWRQIAAPPAGVTDGVVLWTGTEMAVWSNGASDAASAAYNPTTDTWRSIADPPVPGSVAFWIGDQAVFVEDPDAGSRGFAYDMTTDTWRRLADGPWRDLVCWCSVGPAPVWTGTTIIVVTNTDSSTGTSLSGYDPVTDTWRVLGGLDGGSDVPVLIPGLDGADATVAMLSEKPGTPVVLLDDSGTVIGELAGRPAELASTCSQPAGNTGCLLTSLYAVSVGDEVLFWYSGDGWAFDPKAQTWRLFSLDGRAPKWDGTEIVTAGDLLFAWGAGRDGLVYRAAPTE